MPRPTVVRALSGWRLWLRYDDGSEGTADLSDLAGRGVFKAWDDESFFRDAHIGSHGAVEWGSEIDLCSDALYLRLTGKSPEELFPAIRSLHADA